MFPYFVLFGSLATVSCVSLLVGKRLSTWGLRFCFVILFCFMAFRSKTVGADTFSYVALYMSHGSTYRNVIQVFAGQGGLTALYDVYAFIVYKLFHAEQAILVCNSVVICFGFYKFIQTFSSEPFFALMLYVFTFCYFFAFNGMRQSMACSLVLLAMVCLQRDFRIVAACLMLLAIGIHQTSLFAVAVVLASFILSKSEMYSCSRIFTGALFFAFAISILYRPLFNLFSGVFGHYAMYREGASSFSVTDSTQGRQTLVYAATGFLMLLSISSKRVRNIISNSGSDRVCWLIASLCVGFGLFCTKAELLARLIYYLVPGYVCSLSAVVSAADSRNKTIILGLFLLAAYFLLCIYMLASNYSIIVPYRFFWQ